MWSNYSCFSPSVNALLLPCTPFLVATMSSWTAADMIKEIENIGKLWQARGVTKVAEAMVGNAVRKLKSMESLEAASAIQLYEAIDAAQLESTLKLKLSETVDDLVTACDAAGGAEANSGSGQRLLTPFNYLTQSDWAKIDAPDASYWNIIYVTVERLKKCGVKPPMAECTVRWSAATLVSSALEKTGKMPSYDAIHQLVKDLKQSLSCNVKCHPDLQPPRVYPQAPRPSIMRESVRRNLSKLVTQASRVR